MIETLRVSSPPSLKSDSIDILAVAEQILKLFPLPDTLQPVPELPDYEERAERLKQVQQNSIFRKSRSVQEEDDGNVTRPGEYYRRYRTVDELPEEAKTFYEIAGRFVRPY